MNYFDLAILAIAVLMVITGAVRGFIVSLLSMLKFVIGVPLSYFVSSLCYRQIYDEFVKARAYESVYNELSNNGSADDLLVSVQNFVNELPEFFSGEFDLSALNGLSVEQISRQLVDSVLEPIFLTVIKVAVFLLVLIVFGIIISVLISVFSTLQKKKNMPLKHTNSLLGALFGFVKAGIFVFTVSTVVGYICAVVPLDSSVAQYFNNSFILEFINSSNPFLTL